MPELVEGPGRHRRHRDGFRLTDRRWSRLEVLDTIDYCLYCHNRDKDSCSKGMRDKEGNLKPNPLGITLTCNVAGKTAYLAEVQQSGVFQISGFEDAGIDAMLGTQCPSVLYPYAAANISHLIQAGGFPPFYMQPINFESLYGETLRQRAAQAAGGGLAGAETAGNA
jgi:protein-export chaperone SecB